MALFDLGLDGVIQSWNPGAERIFGFTSDEIVGRGRNISGRAVPAYAWTAISREWARSW